MKAGLQVDEGVAGRAVQNSRGGKHDVFKLGGRLDK